MRVLVADDDLASRRILAMALGKMGFDALTVPDGDAAWETLAGPDPPRLAVLDWKMPGMDGTEICRRVRAPGSARPPCYIILLTGMAGRENMVEGLSAGADDYIVKPFDKGELAARLNVGKRVVELQDTLARRIQELEEAQNHIKTLQGIIPICMHCHKIRTDPESWVRLEKYFESHSDAKFSHSICDECLVKHYGYLKGPGEKSV
jgi:DNA-binding response OmpR family regulator